MSNDLSGRLPRRLRELCLLTVIVLAAGCGGTHTLALATITPSPANIAWLAPVLERDADANARWRAAVGPPITLEPAVVTAPSIDALTIVSWNVALDGGDIVGLVRELRARHPERPVVLLLQEAVRGGDEIPHSPVAASFAGHLGQCRRDREIDDVARALGFSLYYVPSMGNGAPGVNREDRGNAVLSSLPLGDLAAIELPFEHQRRVAVAATIGGRTSSGSSWSLRLVNVHLDNLGGARHGWIGSEFGRARQARGLLEALPDDGATVLAGDFNTWFGFRDRVYRDTARAFPQTRVEDPRRTFRGLLRLDHVFYRLRPEWSASVRRGESSLGSDHHPLITTIRFAGV